MLLCLLLPAPAWAPPVRDPRQRIAVVDTGVLPTAELSPYLCRDGHVDITGTGLLDTVGHGTNVATIVSRGMDPAKQCLLIVKWYDRHCKYLRCRLDLPAYTRSDDQLGAVAVVNAAVAGGAVLVNMSYGGQGYYPAEAAQVRAGLDRGVLFVMAAGNDGHDLGRHCDYFPACSFRTVPGVYVVGSLDHKGHRSAFSNYGTPVNRWERGEHVSAGGSTLSGTSQATARASAGLAKLLRPQ